MNRGGARYWRSHALARKEPAQSAVEENVAHPLVSSGTERTGDGRATGPEAVAKRTNQIEEGNTIATHPFAKSVFKKRERMGQPAADHGAIQRGRNYPTA